MDTTWITENRRLIARMDQIDTDVLLRMTTGLSDEDFRVVEMMLILRGEWSYPEAPHEGSYVVKRYDDASWEQVLVEIYESFYWPREGTHLGTVLGGFPLTFAFHDEIAWEEQRVKKLADHLIQHPEHDQQDADHWLFFGDTRPDYVSEAYGLESEAEYQGRIAGHPSNGRPDCPYSPQTRSAMQFWNKASSAASEAWADERRSRNQEREREIIRDLRAHGTRIKRY